MRIDEPATTTNPWLRIGLRLVVATMAYNILEACIALWSGIAAESIALVGFGLDSVIETMAAGVLLWRLRRRRLPLSWMMFKSSHSPRQFSRFNQTLRRCKKDIRISLENRLPHSVH